MHLNLPDYSLQTREIIGTVHIRPDPQGKSDIGWITVRIAGTTVLRTTGRPGDAFDLGPASARQPAGGSQPVLATNHFPGQDGGTVSTSTSAAWIGKVDRLDAPPVLPRDRRGEVDCWICPNGYFVRSNLLARLLEDGTSSPAPASPIKETLADLVAKPGGRVGRKEDGPPKQNYVAAPVLSSHLPLSARAFCAVATGEAILPEVELMVRTLRRHHAEPMVLVCDEPVAARMKELGLPKIEIEPVTDQLRAYAAKLSERVVRHDPYWKPDAIALKFHALRTAIRRHGPTHLLDANIVVNASLHSGGPWMADLVLSPFHWPDASAPTSSAHGFFNAGYLLARHTRIVDRWEQMYAEGLGGFYEQKCLEALGREFVTA